MKKQIITFAFALLLFPVVAFCGEVVILTTTDLHGRAEELAALAPILRDDPDAIRIDCGDTIQGTLFSRHNDGRAMIDLLNGFRFDVWVPGNHDFEFGTEALAQAAKRFRGKTLGAEYHHVNFRPEAWTLLKRKRYKVAVIGMTDPKMPQRLLPDAGWNFEPNRDALKRILPEVLNAQPDLIVLAWHSGMHTPPGSMFRFFAEFPEIDLVLGAHSHEEVPGRNIAGAWYVQAGRYAQCVGRVVAEFDDDTGKLRRIRSELLRPPQKIQTDMISERILKQYQPKYQSTADLLLTITNQPLGLPKKGDNTALINFLGAEAMRNATEADAALFSCSALPEFKIPNRVTNAGLFRLLPYENELCTIGLTRPEITRLVKEIGEASRRGRSSFRFPALMSTTPQKATGTLKTHRKNSSSPSPPTRF